MNVGSEQKKMSNDFESHKKRDLHFFHDIIPSEHAMSNLWVFLPSKLDNETIKFMSF